MKQQFVWSFAAQLVGLILPPLILIALARILEPSDFGIFSLITVTIGALQAISIGALGEVIVKSDKENIGDFIFTIQFLLSIVISVMLLTGADLIADFFKKPEIAAPMRVSCLLILITPIVETSIKISVREIDFRVVFVRRIVTPVVNAVIAIPLALYGAHYWALVWGQIGGTLAAGLVIISMGGWHPRINLEVMRFLGDLRFTWQMVLQGMVRWMRNQSDKAILGYHISSTILGQYEVAKLLAGLPFASIVNPVSQVMYPIMADQLRRGKDIIELFLLVQRRVLLLSFPLCVVMLINAEGLITIVLGAKWLDISGAFVMLTVTAAIYVPIGLNVELFKAMGKPHIMTILMLVHGAFSLFVFLWLAPKGVSVLVFGVVGLSLVFSPLNIILMLKLLGVSGYNYIIRVLLRPLLIAVVVAIVNLMIIRLMVALIPSTILNVIASGLIILLAGFYWDRDLFVLRRG